MIVGAKKNDSSSAGGTIERRLNEFREKEDLTPEALNENFPLTMSCNPEYRFCFSQIRCDRPTLPVGLSRNEEER